MTTMRCAFLFAGQGAQFVGMGKDLAAASPAAAQVFALADRLLGRDLARLCFEGPAEALTRTSVCQPAITVTSLACLAALQERRPLAPAGCAGLSLGEFAALSAAGALAAEDAIRLVAERGRLMEEACRATAGAMAAVLNADPALVERVCAEQGVDVANLNCPGQIVISGEKARLAATVEALKAAGVSRLVPLQVDGAYHSRLMAGAVPGVAAALAQVPLQAPRCLVAQNVTGALVQAPADIRRNLEAQITGSVRWEACVRALIAAGAEGFIEFGPGQVLAGFMKRIDRNLPVASVGGLADLDRLLADPRWPA
jgi:[acyl-carrier-protein] S-malonyltransferase